MAKEVELSWRAIEDMRDVLLENGFVAAQHATPEQIARKIQKWWPGGVNAFLKHYGHA